MKGGGVETGLVSGRVVATTGFAIVVLFVL